MIRRKRASPDNTRPSHSSHETEDVALPYVVESTDNESGEEPSGNAREHVLSHQFSSLSVSSQRIYPDLSPFQTPSPPPPRPVKRSQKSQPPPPTIYNFWTYCLGGVLSFIVFAAFLGYFQKAPTPEATTKESRLMQRLTKLKQEYSHQDPETWSVCHGTFKAFLKRLSTSKQRPAVILLASSEATDTTARCFLHSVDHLIFQEGDLLFPHGGACYTTSIYGEWGLHQESNDTDAIEMAKLKLDEAFKHAYQQQHSRCLILPHVERYPRDLLNLIHALTDPDTSEYKDIFIFLHYHLQNLVSVTTEKENEDASTYWNVPAIRTDMRETFLRNGYFNSEVNALLGRIANNVIHLKHENGMSTRGCPLQ